MNPLTRAESINKTRVIVIALNIEMITPIANVSANPWIKLVENQYKNLAKLEKIIL